MKKLGILVAALLLASPALGQGRGPYMNTESPQVHPIEVAQISGHDYLLVVNTPDNALEIWDTDESVPTGQRFLARVRTGLEPVSVRWVPQRRRAFVTNFLGDSITEISISADGGPATLGTLVVQTALVTDEPLDLVYADVPDDAGTTTTPTLFVTHMALDAFSRLNAVTLQPVAPGDERLPALVASGQDLDFDTVDDDIALKEPWTPAVFCDQLFILGHKGGNTARYDFDLYRAPIAGGPATAIANIGSTNWNMAFGANGDLYIVGAQSRNKNLIGEAAVAAARTGFVKSMFYLVENPCSANPIIHRRDINLRPFAIQIEDPFQTFPLHAGPDAKMIVAQPATGPVPKGQALAQPTSLVPFERDGFPTKVFITAMGSDRVGVIEPSASVNPINWPRRRINLTPVTPGAMAGPRGIALRPASDDGTIPARLYVLNRIDPSVSVIDPVSETEVVGASFALNTTNIEPPEILAGRRFLYDAKLSGKGFVSCSSCHPDARTDAQAWQLSDFIPGVDIPDEIDFFDPNNVFPDDYPEDKGFIVTQSLQGLLNFEVRPEDQELFSNKPYHWRGDRADFQAFNGAFASLLSGDELAPDEIAAYEEFINTVHYPPNPQQDASRIYSGDIGDPDDPMGGMITGNHSGSGALKGLKLFHTGNSDGFSCQGCHGLPEGSDNVLTEFINGVDAFPLQTPPMIGAPGQPIETAALRGLLQKEARLDIDGDSFPEDSPITGYEGMAHTGVDNSRPNTLDFNGLASINAFNLRFFDVSFCTNSVAQLPSFCDNLRTINQYVHEFDWGVGPIVGKTLTATQANAFGAATTQAFDDAEMQAELGNAGAAVQAWISGTKRGFWYDLTGNSGSTPIYVEEPSGATITRNNLLLLMTQFRDRMVLHSTPLGSERRVAAPDGQPVGLNGLTPTAATLLGMVPNTANEPIPSLSEFWNTGNFNAGSHGHTTRLYQNAILFFAGTGAFNVCTVRHEAPRRFRLAAKGLRHGAVLRLFVPASFKPPNTALRPKDVNQVPMRELLLPLHPTGDRLEGQPIWETAAEVDPRILYRLLSGPPVDPLITGIIDNLNDRDFLFQLPEDMSLYPPNSWDPVGFNQHFVRVENTDTTSLDAGWQALSIEKGPDCP